MRKPEQIRGDLDRAIAWLDRKLAIRQIREHADTRAGFELARELLGEFRAQMIVPQYVQADQPEPESREWWKRD